MMTQKIFRPEQPVEVRVEETELIVRLADGRIIRTPRRWYPWLMDASDKELRNVELDALGIFWPDLDDGIDIDWMIEQAPFHPKQAVVVKAEGSRSSQIFEPTIGRAVYISMAQTGSADVERRGRRQIIVSDYDFARQ